MGPYAGTKTPLERVNELGELFLTSGLRAEVMPDLLPAQWSKLIFNAAVNGVAALTELPHVNLFARRESDTDLGHLVHDLMAEGCAVAAAVGVELHDDPWQMNCLAVARGESDHGDYAHPPSMLEDVLARRQTEVDAITGALVREGTRVGVPTPLNQAVYRLIKGKEESWKRAPRESASSAAAR
jgi:2-dehydropantoate 2-reductase